MLLSSLAPDREAVAAASNGLNELMVTAGLEGFAKVADMHIDRPLADMNVSAPDEIEQLVTTVNAFRMGHEEMKQPELRRPKIKIALVGRNSMAERIKAQSVYIDCLIGGLGFYAA